MNDNEDPNDEVRYHLEVGPTDLVNTVLLPGSPERMDRVMALRGDREEEAPHREYQIATGSYDRISISATSTGIRSPSATIAVEELTRVDTDTFVHVGSCDAIRPEMDADDLVITSGAVRQEGTSKEYAREDYPAVAGHEAVSALVTVVRRPGYNCHVGLMVNTDFFYARQGRPGLGGFCVAGSDSLVEELREASVKSIEMEAAALPTIANIYGLRAGAACLVYANRVTGEFRTEGESRVAETASLAVHLLAKTDEVRHEAGVGRWHTGPSPD